MADHTPTTDEVRDIYTWDRCVRHGRDDSLDTRHVRADFDRWLAQERAEAGARALEQAAEWLRSDMDEPWGDRAANRLDVRAARIRAGGA